MSDTNAQHTEVRRITSAADLQRAFDIRRQVFLVEQKVPPDEEFDEDDQRALHVLAFVDGEPVATGRLIVDGDRARVGRMAVLSTHRARGIGRAILEELLRAATEDGLREVVLHAQTHAIGFYQSLGFEACGAVFDEAGIPHRRMQRTL